MSIWNIFGKKPRDYFLDFNPLETHWRVVSWNFDLSDTDQRRWVVEAHGKKSKVIHWDKKQGDEVRFYENDSLVSKTRMKKSSEEFKSLMNLAIHSTLKHSIEANREFMVTAVSGATALDMQNETRALQWIQATFKTLTGALDGLKNNPKMILTGACFSGTVPDTKEEVLRLIAFNLDIFYYLREDKSLQIVVFDDKNLGHGETKSPTYSQIIKVTKPQFYDEITKLLHCFAQVGEIR